MKIKKTNLIAKVMAMALALALSIGFIPVNAYAAQAQDQPKAGAEQVAANINYDITVTFNGEAKALSNVNGQQVYPVLYGGTTYVPIRAIGYLLGLNVDWDQATRTVLLDKPANGQTADVKTAKPDDPKKTGTEAIRPVIDPGITVKYNGEVQTMKTATGAVVYPMIDGGTTYLPIRAVSNMLGLDVDWEQATQTVKLTNTAKEKITVTGMDGKVYEFDADITPEELARIMHDIDLGIGDISDIVDNSTHDTLGDFKTSPNAEYVTETHVTNGWFSIDWTNAANGYVRIKLDEKATEYVHGYVRIAWIGQDGKAASDEYKIYSGEWFTIPLTGGDNEYAVSVRMVWQVAELPESVRGVRIPTLTARFNADINDGASRWVLSTPEIDFEHSPNTCAKALEITKNCKTDAERITAVFNWVASNIKYDYALFENITARKTADPGKRPPSLFPSNEKDYNYYTNPDRILAAKSGVCEHYAALMTAMLRSLGVECKCVGGFADANHDVNQNFSKLDAHAWVAVNPKTGELNKTALGAGNSVDPKTNEPDGWIRLDPTWGDTATGRADAAIDTNYQPINWN